MKRTTCSILSVFILSLLGFACAKERDDKDTQSGESAECNRETEIQSSCLSSAVLIDQDVNKVDKADLLFVIDNSKSMEQEQAKLRDQIPRMIKVLTTGDKIPENGFEDRDFPPIKDLHLAVVSTDMGLPTLAPEENPDVTGACNGTGDDGNFLHDPSEAIVAGMNCPGIGGGGYPVFLEHLREEREDPNVTIQRAEATAAAFECVATLGISGCGFEMQLESPLKALWPSQMSNLTEVHQSLGIQFLAGSQGHGDNEHRSFLRGTPYHPTEPDKLSVLAIIVVTDEEDCSAGARGNLDFLSLNYPGGDRQDLNLRCYKDSVNNWGNKYPVSRYIDGFRALRPPFSDLVVFAAITGIPNNIWEDANGDADISPQERQDYYNQILTHPDMVETPNPDMNNLYYSCIHQDPNTGEFDTQAFPARRITEVAQGFGDNGVIRSICADDFTPAINSIIDVISNKIGRVCLPRAYTRKADGTIDCDIVWTMPSDLTCDDFEYLNDPEEGEPQYAENGRKRCVVDQLPVINSNTNNPAEALDFNTKSGLGWYYDNFSADMERSCKATEQITTKQRISFTLSPGMNGQNEDPPSGVSIDLECLQQIAISPEMYSDGATSKSSYDPEIAKVGLPCETEDGGAYCAPAGVEPGQLFCSEQSLVCVLSCRDDADCPTDWVCDDTRRGESGFDGGFCVNPICELPEGEAVNCGNSDVGEKCLPLYVPTEGFSSNDIYIETNSASCETRICGVFGFKGDPRTLSTQKVNNKIYCTCRCRSDDPDVSTCECPDGFECSEDLLANAGSALAGGYCVRE